MSGIIDTELFSWVVGWICPVDRPLPGSVLRKDLYSDDATPVSALDERVDAVDAVDGLSFLQFSSYQSVSPDNFDPSDSGSLQAVIHEQDLLLNPEDDYEGSFGGDDNARLEDDSYKRRAGRRRSRSFKSVMCVANRWGISYEDARELMLNVESANSETRDVD